MILSGRSSSQYHPHSGDGKPEAQREEGTPPRLPNMLGPMMVAADPCFSPSWLGRFLIFVQVWQGN